MFYYLIRPIVSYNFFLMAAAAVPAIFLMVRVYRSDRLEKESPRLMWRLVKAGVFSSLIALVEERVLSRVLGWFAEENTLIYNVILYFVIVAVAEESSKYLLLRRETWRSPEFNSQYDGVVYAVFVSLGFALWENISYVLSYGFATAVVRAVTAIPGHACFGVFMGVFYGAARKYENFGQPAVSKALRCLCLLIPALLHGAYDFIATMEQTSGGWYFFAFVTVLFVVSYLLVGKTSKRDQYIA